MNKRMVWLRKSVIFGGVFGLLYGGMFTVAIAIANTFVLTINPVTFKTLLVACICCGLAGILLGCIMGGVMDEIESIKATRNDTTESGKE